MMKTWIQLKRASGVLGVGLLLLSRGGAAANFTVFGLKQTLLTNTVLNTNAGCRLCVENASLAACPDDECDPLDGFGVTVHLGEAQSGLFAYPDDADAVQEVDSSFSGYLLQGLAYGSVEGVTNRWISSLSATRVEWGQYVMT